ncbi:MAG: molecular chaperone [Sutterella wadsworthensis]
MNQNEKAALREILAQRESMYRLLARLYKTEADKDLLDGLGAAGFPEEDGGLGEGFRLIADWLRDPKSEDPVTELAVDYAHTFLGAGIADGLVSYPFESVYTSPGRLVMQDAWEDVAASTVSTGSAYEQADMHEDQIGLECEFMAILRAGL